MFPPQVMEQVKDGGSPSENTHPALWAAQLSSLSQEKQGVSAVRLHGAEPNPRVLLPFPPVSAKAVTISTQHSRLEGRRHPGTWSQVQGILLGVSPGPSSRLWIKPVLLLLYTWLRLLEIPFFIFLLPHI